MSVKYEKAVSEDLNTGYGSVSVTMPGGGSATGSKIGLHSFSQNGWFHASDFGVRADGRDDSAAIQAAIDRASTTGRGATVWLPPGDIYATNLKLKASITLRGYNSAEFYETAGPPAATPTTILHNLRGTTPLITSATDFVGGAVRDLLLYGFGSGSADRGIYIPTGVAVVRMRVEHVCCNNFAEQGIFIESTTSLGGFINNVFTLNCLLTRSRASRTGTIHLNSTDWWMSQCECTSSESSITNASLYNCGIYINGANAFVNQCVGETSEIGIAIGANKGRGRLVACRSDLNRGHGFAIDGGSHHIVACYALNDGLETANTYDGFNFASTGAGCTLVACDAETQAGHNAIRYGFNCGDLSLGSSQFIGCRSLGYATADFNFPVNQIRHDNQIVLPEITAPSAPTGNQAVFFIRDNGAGKTQACVRFNTGAIQVLATEP